MISSLSFPLSSTLQTMMMMMVIVSRKSAWNWKILHFPFLNDPESEFNFSSFFNPLPLSFCFHLKLNHDSVPVLNEKLSGKCFASLKNTFSMFQGDEGHALKWWKYFTTAHKFYEERQKCKKLRLFRADDPSTCSWQFYSHQLNDTRILLVSNLWVKSEQ